MIVDRIETKKNQRALACKKPSVVYLGRRQLRELYAIADLYSHVKVQPKRNHEVHGLTIYEVNEDSHLEVF